MTATATAMFATSRTGSLPVAPHVWFVLLAAGVLASAEVLLSARNGLAAAGALVSLSIASGGVAVLGGAELVAVALVVLGALGGLGALLTARASRSEPASSSTVRGRAGGVRRLVAAVIGGAVLAGSTAAVTCSTMGAARVAAGAQPQSAAALANPLFAGGALLVDGTALVLLVALVATRRAASLDDERGR